MNAVIFFSNVLLSPLKYETEQLPIVQILPVTVGFVFGICTAVVELVFIPQITIFCLCCGRGISAVSLANPAVAALCLEHNWSCIYQAWCLVY